jgi:hypothetical protein
MVTYQASSASKQVTISELVYATALTLVVPTNPIAEGTGFAVSGRLTYREGGVDYGLSGRTINISGGVTGTLTTGTDGSYSLNTVIAHFGTYTITASFAGATGLSASYATGGVNVFSAEAPDVGMLILLGFGLFLGYQVLKKK